MSLFSTYFFLKLFIPFYGCTPLPDIAPIINHGASLYESAISCTNSVEFSYAFFLIAAAAVALRIISTLRNSLRLVDNAYQTVGT
jgi:hypothetical protein